MLDGDDSLEPPFIEEVSKMLCENPSMIAASSWLQCGGYDETMRSGFEDWDFFLNMLEAVPNTSIGILEKPLINYRTAPASSNVKSMGKRLDLMRYIIEKHINIYKDHIAEAVLDIESISMSRLYGWESEMIASKLTGRNLSSLSNEFMESPSYGDGGMAAAVRIASAHKRRRR